MEIQTIESERTCMTKDFQNYIAWTHVKKEGDKFFGCIEYQRKIPDASVDTLWVMASNMTQQIGAEIAAIRMLSHILDININGRIIYNDGLAL